MAELEKNPMMGPVAQLNAVLAARYDVEREIGRGGMATVYLARDVKHNRKVALKVLNPELGAVLGVERFLSEIQVAANLQHPHLLPLYDSGEANGLLYYVMPYVEGDGLRERLNREKQLPIDEAVRIAAQVASALDYAHKHGVIHRDLKPENILMQGGEPFVADFGIALAVTNAGGNRITQTGLSLGTPQYMSPEQATGERVVDARSDIYSLGCVLYEMLAGEPPHMGGTAQAVIAKILTEPPRDVRELRDRVPENIALIIDRALAKVPADRFATAGDMQSALLGRATVQRRADRRKPRAESRKLPWLLTAAALIAAVGFALKSAVKSAPKSAVKFQITLRNAELIDGFALSRDGKSLAYMMNVGASKQLAVRDLGELEARALPGTDGADHPVWSPSGKSIAFLMNGQVQKTSPAGGPVQMVSPFGFGYDWIDDESMVIGSTLNGGGLRRSSTAGAVLPTITKLATDSGELWHVYPLVLPKHKVAFVIWGAGGLEDDYLAVGDLETGKYVESHLVAITTLAYQDGWLLYQDPERRLMATRVDLGAMTLGAPVLVQPNVVSATLTPRGAVTLLGERTTGIYRISLRDKAPSTVPASQSPLATPAENAAVLESDGVITGVRLSPEGSRIAYVIARADSAQLFVHDLRTHTSVRLWNGYGVKDPAWTPDGKEVLFSEGAPRLGMWRIPADGGTPRVIVTKDYPRHGVVSPDGKTLVYMASVPGGPNERQYDIWSVTLEGAPAPHAIVTGHDSKSLVAISPNARWLAFDSDENTRDEVYVRPASGGPGQWRVSVAGGMEPRWSRDGKRLFYRSGGDVIAATLRETAAGIEVLSRVPVAHFALSSLSPWDPMYDVSGPNELLVASANEKGWQLVFTQDWLADLRRAVQR